MQLKAGTKILQYYPWKRMVYILCFLMFCVIDWGTKVAFSFWGWGVALRNLMGTVMFCLILTHYKTEDFWRWKIPYLIWTVLGIMGGIGVFWMGREDHAALSAWCILVLDVVLFGYVIIHTFLSVVLEKKVPKHNRVFFMLWFAMMLWMIISRSSYVWPFCYMVMFGCFYLTDFTAEEQENLFHGALDGIICAFLLFQGYCLVFRPYDRVQYEGIYSNCNMNALFYLEVLAAVLVKLLYVTKQNAKKWVKVFYWLGAGVVLSFLFMTIGRTAWFLAFILGVTFLIVWNKISGVQRFFRNGILLVLCMCLTFPLCYGLIRYVPSVFHHPVWFLGEWNEDRVHSWDAWDSDKYVSIEELMEKSVGRVAELLESVVEHSPFMIKADAAEAVLWEEPEIEQAILPGAETDPITLRGTIYKYYFLHLNLLGHYAKEEGVSLVSYEGLTHAHNIYLQYGTDFGAPVMIMFIVLMVWSIAVCWKRGVQSADSSFSMIDVACLFFILVSAVYGMLEKTWGVGSLNITLLFIAWRQAMSGSGKAGDGNFFPHNS